MPNANVWEAAGAITSAVLAVLFAIWVGFNIYVYVQHRAGEV